MGRRTGSLMIGTGLAVALAAVLLLVVLGRDSPVRAPGRQQPQPTTTPSDSVSPVAANLQCPEGAEILIVESDVVVDVPGGPPTPVEALRSFFQQEKSALDAGDFAVTVDSSTAAQLSYFQNDQLVAFARASKHGDSWYVERFAACDSILASTATG